jgi:hypothetical protein
VKSGPPDQFFLIRGLFCFRVEIISYLEKMKMDKKELAYAKQTVTAVKDWDAYQAVIRSITRLMRALDSPQK